MNKQLLKDMVGWGLILWIIGYLLGIVLFFIVPANLLGWFIMPIGIALTLWVLLKKIPHNTLSYYLSLGIVWTIIAVLADYFLLVQVFKPADGYYKLDVYLYYALTFLLPLLVGLYKSSKSRAVPRH